ncbi:MAG: o-succinylbenzoate synthase [Prevotella sp.]|nr:o-succinylbenzoate synthase [Prevotella sp.]
MSKKINIEERLFHFKQPAGTSRGVYLTRRSWFLTMHDSEGGEAIGECAPLPQLSCDDIPDYAQVLRGYCDDVERTGEIPYEALRPYPSMLFGLEQCLTPCPKPQKDLLIPINGLIWMGTFEEMYQRIEEKLATGFHCVKLKIGAIDWEREIALIRFIRQHFTREQIELRVDANGGFSMENAMNRLEELARYDIHSIEQPIKASPQGENRRWADMALLCKDSSLPIALDEELIGVNSLEEKKSLLDTIHPRYIILKPSLHGGMNGTREWVRLAREREIGSWITSALESNVGLYTIALLAEELYGPDIKMPQGLGTGQLFTDNIPMPLEVRGEKLWVSK